MQVALIAGGAGFIGSHLCQALLLKNFRVICVDNFLTSTKETIASLFSNPNFSLLEHDITKLLEATTIEKVDYIFHLASPASPNKKSPRSYLSFPIETMLVNSYGTYLLLELARKHNASFLYASSSEIYGDPAISPQTEDYFGNVNPNGIRSVYDEGKRFGEAITFAYVRKYNLNARIIRIFNTYGPNMQKDDGRVVSNLINQAIHNHPMTVYGDGKQTRSFCYVLDMVEGIEKAMFASASKGEVFNLGNSDERAILEIATIIKKLVGSSSAIHFEELPKDDPTRRKPNIDKAKKILQWEPEVILEEGLKKTIEYFSLE